MDASTTIRNSIIQVAQLRDAADKSPELAQSVSAIKRFQARRFAATYRDLLHKEPYAQAARFFLDELYSEKNYTRRDAQFARIAGALERLFPQPVQQTAVSLARLHLLTETLDLAMAEHWRADPEKNDVVRYISAWRALGQRGERNTQLAQVLALGRELDQLTRTPGLRLMLKMMRGPANLAGLGDLQRFLEAGFDTFAAMGRQTGATRYFLDTVATRENQLFNLLFESEFVACETQMSQMLAPPR
jgi:exonuclease VII large subunit